MLFCLTLSKTIVKPLFVSSDPKHSHCKTRVVSLCRLSLKKINVKHMFLLWILSNTFVKPAVVPLDPKQNQCKTIVWSLGPKQNLCKANAFSLDPMQNLSNIHVKPKCSR